MTGEAEEGTISAAADLADAALYRETLSAFDAPRRESGSLLFVALFVFFVLGELTDLKSLSGLAILIAVIAFHEVGHAAAMRLFGFRDVRVFFVPLLGAATSGRARGVAAWKEAIVSLLGPLPGIALGVVGMWIFGRHPTPWLFTTVQTLLFLNVFNLLPFGPLDGGRFFRQVLFSRHRVLEVAFMALGSLLLAYVALRGSMFVLLAFAVLGLLALPLRYRLLGAAAALRRRAPAPAQLGALEHRALFDAARGVLGPAAQAKQLGDAMETILDAAKPAPRFLGTLGLLGVYAASLLCGVVALVFVSVQSGGLDWTVVEQPGWRVEFARPPTTRAELLRRDDIPGALSTWHAAVEGVHRFTIQVKDASSPDDAVRWGAAERKRIVSETGLQLAGERAVTVSSRPAQEFELAGPGRILRGRILIVGNRAYEITASAPEWGERQRRFLDSFALRDTP